MKQIKATIYVLRKTVASLKSALDRGMQSDRIALDASIRRFVYVIELFLKFLKLLLSSHGVEVRFPKDVMREAYIGKLIDHDQIWISMLNDRNAISHTYDEQQADIIYDHIKEYYPILQSSFDKLVSDL